MITEEKAKAYDEALERAKELLYSPRTCFDIVQLKDIFPQLKESEDERVRKEIVDFICWAIDRGSITKEQRERSDSWLAYLEKQKEQKPSEWSEEDEKMQYFVNQFLEYHEASDPTAKSCKKWFNNKLKSLRPQPKNEWSKEDEKIACTILNLLCSQVTYVTGQGTTSGKQFPTYAKERDWFEKRFKSLRPPQDRCKDCPHRGDMFLLTQGVKSGKHDLAIKFMNYLDENRPEGKRSLSNAECEDIDKAFKENDWEKIIRYIEKYKPHWKPTKEQMEALDEYIYAKYPDTEKYSKAVLSLKDDLKKLMQNIGCVSSEN